jgi:protoheme IX farnesyltransferase
MTAVKDSLAGEALPDGKNRQTAGRFHIARPRALIPYLEVTKPASVALLAFTTLGTMSVASRAHTPSSALSAGVWVKAMAAITLATAGTNAVTCYIDRDMDAVMERTKRRPIPAKRIVPAELALAWGLALFAASLLLGWFINPLSALLLLLGFLDDAVVYNLLTKRRSPLNVILGGFSGGLPALFGWTAVTNSVSATPVLMAALVVLWIPNHIWNLAIAHTEDYRKVQVPMLPAVFSLQSTARCIACTVVLMYALSMVLGFVGPFGWIYLATALVAGLVVLIGNIGLVLRPTRERAWAMFKLSSPYLFVLFLAMIADVLLR